MPYTRSIIEPKYDYYLGDWTSDLETIVRSGAEVFEKIAPYVLKRKEPTPPYTGYPSPYPQFPATYRYGSMPRGGIPGMAQAQPMPTWFWPAAAAIGGFALITMMQPKKR